MNGISYRYVMSCTSWNKLIYNHDYLKGQGANPHIRKYTCIAAWEVVLKRRTLFPCTFLNMCHFYYDIIMKDVLLSDNKWEIAYGKSYNLLVWWWHWCFTHPYLRNRYAICLSRVSIFVILFNKDICHNTQIVTIPILSQYPYYPYTTIPILKI